jgi:hypothetical protein
MKKIICFDLDNVICRTTENNYEFSKPIKKSINLINRLYKKGYLIKIFTARGMGKYKDNYSLAVKNYQYLTKKQLRKWKVNHHKLIFGKPAYDYFIDDKAYGFTKNWQSNFLKNLKRKL